MFGSEPPSDPESGPRFIRDAIAAMDPMRVADLENAVIHRGSARRLLSRR
jgi:hypothetical protein